MNRIIKTYRDFPAARRLPKHSGKARFVHGHTWEVVFGICSRITDNCGSVVDPVRLDGLDRMMSRTMDHTILLNINDPWREHVKTLDLAGEFFKVVAVPDCSTIGLANELLILATHALAHQFREEWTDRGIMVESVILAQDSSNKAIASLDSARAYCQKHGLAFPYKIKENES